MRCPVRTRISLYRRHTKTYDIIGRSWTAPELRRKSFKDIHTLWYILLREQNLLATQRHELKRVGADVRRTEVGKKAFRVRVFPSCSGP